MRVFVDTSSLIKKYVEEKGREKLIEIMDKASEIIVSPVTYIETINAVTRICDELKLSTRQKAKIKEVVDIDFEYFIKIALNSELEHIARKCSEKHLMKALDLIQLSAAIIAKPSLFVTSDKHLFKAAEKELKKRDFI